MTKKKIMDAGDLSADITDAVFYQNKHELFVLTLDYSGIADAVGDFELEYSPDYEGIGTPSDFTWVPVNGGTIVKALTGSAGKHNQAYRGVSGWYRLFWDFTSDGSADTADAWVESGSGG